ncbi:MAG TPA: hypothetical protein VFS15_00970 [Kofleriaceae bacterium]|nr:hypothetical protein [Kofleriaceae bacterium]
MMTESIAVPAERVPPVASDMASSSKTLAGVLLFFCAIMAIAMIGVVTGDSKSSANDYEPKDSAEAAGHAVGMIIGVGLMAGLPGWFGFRAARNASRATRAGNVAKSDPSYTWRLSGKYIIAADGHGAPHPELSFKVNGKLRTMLLAVPRAAVVDRSS